MGQSAEALLGLIAVLALLSATVSVLAQVTQSVLRLRSRNLYRGLESLFAQAFSQREWAPKRSGLLVIHGVGEQKPGRTGAGFVHGLSLAYPGAMIERRDETRWVIRKDAGEVRVYEVHWADLLGARRVRGTFDLDALRELVWFPRLNFDYQHRLPDGYGARYPAALVRWYTGVLQIAGALVTAAYWGTVLLTIPLGAVIDAARDRRSRRDGDARPRAERNRAWLDDFLAARIGDVFNYVDACVGRAEGGLASVDEQIYKRFEAQLRCACQDGCEEIEIVSHSLGSLIAYHALERFRDSTEAILTGGPRLARWYTLGSPLEKILFFFPKAIRLDPVASPVALHNFQVQFDPVSGVNRYFGHVGAISNARLVGGGGIALAHVGYRRHPNFLKVLGPSLTGAESAHSWTRLGRGLRVVRSFLENAVGFAVGLALVGAGFGYIGGVWMLITCGVHQAFDSTAGYGSCLIFAAPGGEWTWVASLAMIGMVTVGLVLAGKDEAKRTHEKYWRAPPLLPARAGRSSGPPPA